MSDDTFTLPKIHLGGKAGGAEKGQLKVSPHGLGWRSSHSGHKVALEVWILFFFFAKLFFFLGQSFFFHFFDFRVEN